MAKQQRMGWWFLCLACVVVMVCTAQRMAGLHALQMQATASAAVVSAPSSTDDGSPVTPCELSAKSLLAAPPVLFEGAYPCALSTAFLTGACPGHAPAVFASTGYFAAHITGTSTILCLP